MGGRQGVVAHAHLGADEARLGVGEAAEGDGVGGDGEGAEVLLGRLHQLLVVDAAGADKNHAVSGVVRLDVRDEVITLDGEDVGLGAEDGAPKGLA